MSFSYPQPGVEIETRARVTLDMPAEDAVALEKMIKSARKKIKTRPKGLRFDRIEIIH